MVYNLFAPRVGLEPTTLRLTAACSAIELPRNTLFQQASKISIELSRSQDFLVLFLFFSLLFLEKKL